MSVKTAIVCLLYFFAFGLDENAAIDFKLTNAHCESFNESWVIIKECRLRAKSRKITVLNVQIDVVQPANDVMIHGKLFKKANGYKPFLVDVKIDACQFLKKHNHPIGKMIFNSIKEFSTINHTCPYQGLQILRNFYPRLEALNGLPMPSGEYLLSLKWLFDKKPQSVTDVYFSYIENLI